MKIIHFLIIIISCVFFGMIDHSVFADDATSFAKIGVAYNSTTNTLEITGSVYKTFSQNYALTVFNPQGQLITVSQILLSENDTFSQNILPSNTLWDVAGNYTVKIASGPQVLSEKSFYFPGTTCCMANPQGVRADLSKTDNKTDTPLKQFKSGITPNDVKCRQGLQLVIKAEDNSSACVKPQTVSKLVERGWTESSQITYPCPTTDPSKIVVDFTMKLPSILPRGYSLQGIEQNGGIQTFAYYANKSLCDQDHNFQFHNIHLILSITQQRRPLNDTQYYQLIPDLVGGEWDVKLDPSLISELSYEGINVQTFEVNGYKGFYWIPWNGPFTTMRGDVIKDHSQTASTLWFYNDKDQTVYTLYDLDHQSEVRLLAIAKSIPP